MRRRTRGWIMPEAEIISMLTLIDEKIHSREIEVQHRDALIRLRDILENDLDDQQRDRSAQDQQSNREVAA